MMVMAIWEIAQKMPRGMIRMTYIFASYFLLRVKADEIVMMAGIMMMEKAVMMKW